jgi:hypothetical protein
MSDRPLLNAGNYSPRYGASESSSRNDTPILPYIDNEQTRSVTEKRLLCKLDLRVAFLVLIYIMNFVSWCIWCSRYCLKFLHRWTVIMQRT